MSIQEKKKQPTNLINNVTLVPDSSLFTEHNRQLNNPW